MAQGKKTQDAPGKKPPRERKPVVDRRIQPPPGTRQSVAAARQTSASSNRVQLWIGIVAVVLIAAVVIVGLVLNKVQNASPVSDHPTSTASTATVADGIVTVTGPGAPKLTLDFYEDGICPACQDFESQFGQQVMKAVDDGQLAVRYHFMNFLDAESASKTYSTRVAAAFECVAAIPVAEQPKGLFLNFHTRMFTSGTKPAENGSADLSNADIAAIATKMGVPASAGACISAGTNVAQAKKTADTAKVTLQAATPSGQEIATPAVVKDGAVLNLNSTKWLTNLLA